MEDSLEKVFPAAQSDHYAGDLYVTLSKLHGEVILKTYKRALESGMNPEDAYTYVAEVPQEQHYHAIPCRRSSLD